MSKYYQNELDNLRELAADFANAYPTVAPQLAAASTDPDVERILEGVAFLTAKIRQKIDDDFPEFSQGLLRQIFPHYLRPLPSVTLIQFKPKAILKNRLNIDAGSYLDSVAVEGINCRFRTSFDTEIWPITVNNVRQAETSTGKRFIELSLKFDAIEIDKWDSDTLRLYLGGDFQGATDLNYLLHNHLDSIELESNSADSGVIRAMGVKLKPVGFGSDETLLQYPANSFPAYRLIQEYFLMKEKFLFVDITGLRPYTRSMKGNNLTFRFYLDESPVRIPRLSNDRFILHTTPAINLFTMAAESIRNDQTRAEYLVRPLRNTNNQYDIYAVDSVTGRNRKTAETVDYIESGLSHSASHSSPVYNTLTRQSGDGEKQDTYIAFSYPPDYPLANQETVMLELTCTNGKYPAQLKPGDISKPAPGASELVEFANLLQPTDIQHIEDDGSMLWRLISHLSLNYLSLADTENFKSLLSLYIFSDSSGSKVEVANRKRIEGIEDIRVESCDRLIQGMPMRGQKIEVSLNSANFASRGDLYLFGMLLDYLFGSFSSINSFTEVSLTDTASNETFEWPARVGDRPLI